MAVKDKLVTLEGLAAVTAKTAAYINIVNLTTWASVYNVLSRLTNQNVATVFVGVDSTQFLTNNAVEGVLTGIVSASNVSTGTFDFFCVEANGKFAYNWRISGLTSASATPTVGAIYRYNPKAAPYINLVNLSTWSDIYNALSVLDHQSVANAFVGAASKLTGNKTSAVMQGIVSFSNETNGTYDFMCSSLGGGEMYTWRVTGLKSASSTPTVGTVYKYTGTAL